MGIMKELPDDILAFTLSLLPMREAARTSVLARRWRNLWKTSLKLSTNLSFDIFERRGGRNFSDEMFDFNNKNEKGKVLRREKRKFIKWVNGMLKQYSNRVINSFRLRFCMNRTSADHIDQWLRIAITKKARDFELDFSHFLPQKVPLRKEEDLYVFPYWLFTQEQEPFFNRLCLNSCRISLVHSFCFHSLVDLQLESVAVGQEDFHQFLSNCSNLENLSLDKCWGLQCVKISGLTPKLKCLTVNNCNLVEDIEIVDARNLTILKHYGYATRYSFRNVHGLSDVTILYRSGLYYDVLNYALGELSTDVPDLKSLSLSVGSMDTVIPTQLALFANLQKLVLKVTWFYETLWNCIHLVKRCPLLQILEFHLFPPEPDQCGESEMPFNYNEFHFKEILLTGFNGTSHEIEFMKYLIERSTPLEKVSIDSKFKFYDHKQGFYSKSEVGGSAVEEPNEVKDLEMLVRSELAHFLHPQILLNFL